MGNQRRALISFFRALMSGYTENGVGLFTVVHTERTRGSSHRLKQGKIWQLITEENSSWWGKKALGAAQRGWGISIPGAILDSNG